MAPLLVAISNILAHRCRGVGVIHTIIPPRCVGLRERRPHLAFIAADQNICHGLVLAREGQNATQIGPLVAQNAETARTLLSAVAARVEGPVFIDLVDDHAEIRIWLEGFGFTAQRSFIRMLAGHPQPIDDAARIVVLTGPEFA